MGKGLGAVVALVVVILVALAVIGYLGILSGRPGPSAPAPFATVLYSCNGGKTITASFYQGSTTPPAAPGQPPTPGGSVALSLSDGRSYTLKQTLSADGSRYSNGNPMVEGSESFVFWAKGNGALVLEDNVQKSYIGCIKVAPEPSGVSLPQIYTNNGDGFSIRLPAGYTPDASYTYQELGPGKGITGVKFTIPTSVATGTNLAPDTYLSVEEIPSRAVPPQACSATRFLGPGVKASTTTDDGVTYSVASSTGAGAGNRYEETIYAIRGTDPCVAVRYFIHYGVIENYPPGAVRAFDQAALLAEFDAIRRTLTINQ